MKIEEVEEAEEGKEKNSSLGEWSPQKTSSDETLKSEEIERNDADFSLVTTKVEEEEETKEEKEKKSVLDEWSPQKTSSDETLKSEEIERNNADFSLVKMKVREKEEAEEGKEKNSSLGEWSSQKTSSDETLKSEEIMRNNAEFFLVTTKVEKEEAAEEGKEKNSSLGDQWSPIRVEPNLLTTRVDSDSTDYIVSSGSSEISDSDWPKWPSLTVKPRYSNEPIYSIISSSEPKNFKEIADETKPIVNKPFKIVGIGMYNLGNTCFLNVVIQCFMHTVVLLQRLASIDHVSPCDNFVNGFCVICMFRELTDFSMFYGRHFVIPWKLINHLSKFSSDFLWNQQEDAHEFLQCFLNKLESCCNNLDPKDTAAVNIVKEAFGGRLVSRLRCCVCGHFSATYESLIDLSLEIDDADSVSEALESFTRIERLEYFCERCKIQVPAEKQFLIDQAPSVAALHLKRFKNNGIVIQKADKHVSFPLELDLLFYTNQIHNEEMKYDLYAVIVHAGVSLSSGHYYSFIRCAPNEWYKYDDEQVLRVHEDVVLAEEAYIMFYAKRGTPWFSDYIQIHRPFVDLPIINISPCISRNHALDDAADETSPKPELNNESKETLQTPSTPGPEIHPSDSPANQVYREDQLQEVKIKQANSLMEERIPRSQDGEFVDALHGVSHSESCMNDKKRKMEDSPSRDDTPSSKNSK